MNKPKYGVRYVCDDYPDVILGWDETVESSIGFYFFRKYTPDMKQYTGTALINPEYFNECFKELPR
jgi:hypothetical protein